MPYILPTFNLTCNIWHNHDQSTGAPAGAPDVVSNCNLQYGRKINLGYAFEGLYLLLPAGTDVRDWSQDVTSAWIYDVVEVPAGSGRWYQGQYWEDVAKGFDNEYRVLVLLKINPLIHTDFLWPIPGP